MKEADVASRRLTADVGSYLTRGAVGGLAAGLLFLLANMGWATRAGMPGVAPLIDIATIFNVTETPDPTPENISIGLVTHLNLSVLFGIAFALIATGIRDGRTLLLAGAAYGVALYVVNFQVLGRTAFPWFQDGPDQLFELFAHLGYGLLLAPFLIGLHRRQPPTPEAGDARSAVTQDAQPTARMPA